MVPVLMLFDALCPSIVGLLHQAEYREPQLSALLLYENLELDLNASHGHNQQMESNQDIQFSRRSSWWLIMVTDCQTRHRFDTVCQ